MERRRVRALFACVLGTVLVFAACWAGFAYDSTAPTAPTAAEPPSALALASEAKEKDLWVQDSIPIATVTTEPPRTDTTSFSDISRTIPTETFSSTSSAPTTTTKPPATTAVVAPSAELSPVQLSVGESSFRMGISGGREITVLYYAADVDLTTARIVIAMHGASRNAAGALHAWTEIADEHGLIIAVPELTNDLFPGDAYNLGGTFTGGQLTPSTDWAFPIVEQLFDQVVGATGSSQKQYVLYGHSAGAQFVERFALLWQPNRVSVFVAAGAGWYTMVDDQVDYPYGLLGGPTNSSKASAVFGSRVLVLVGEFDTDDSAKDLRQTAGAQAQGSNRRERAAYFFDHAAATAAALGSPFNWRFGVVSGASHENRPMAAETARILFQ